MVRTTARQSTDLVLCSGTVPRGTTFLDRLRAASAAGFSAISRWGRDDGAAGAEGHSDADLPSVIDDHGRAVAELDPAWRWTPGARGAHIPPEVDPVDIFDLAGCLCALGHVGSRAPMGVEVFSDELHAPGLHTAARLATDTTRRLLGGIDWGSAS